jgi:predicted secreted hydrolase
MSSACRLRMPRLIGWLLLAALALTARADGSDPPLAPVVPGLALVFPRDYGSHPDFGVEWWYLTGWLSTDQRESLGFQVTFFRTRVANAQDNPSAFNARQLLIAHCAISDPARGHLWQDQRIRRAGMQLAEASNDDTRVWIDDWRLERAGNRYQTQISAAEFALQLSLQITQPELLNGVNGFSQKGPAQLSASYYYSQPQLRVNGNLVRAGRASHVSGVAWLDHEWSSQYLDQSADGWDWIGLNMNDGGALMAFRIRDHQGKTFWSAATERDAQGHTHSLNADQIEFIPRHMWRSPRTGTHYPVSWRIRIGSHVLELEPLMDDQENDTRLSTGAIYWEGAVRVEEGGRENGRGYLELTGYEKPLTLR